MSDEQRFKTADEAPLELAELQVEVLDDALLHRLFEDLDALAAIDEVRVKGGAAAYAQERPVALHEALERLLAGRIQAAQVVYEYRGRTWCDTIVRQGGSHRLVRMESPRRLASAAPKGDE